MFVNLAVKQDVKTFMNEADKRIAERIDGIVAEMRKQIASTLFSEETVNESKPIIISQANKKAAIQKSRLQKRLDTLKKNDKKEDVDEEEVVTERKWHQTGPFRVAQELKAQKEKIKK